MAPLTELVPKPALPVLNEPMIGHVLRHLAAHGVTFAVINCHHMPDLLEEAAARCAPEPMEVRFSREPSLLGTAGGLRKVARHFEDETFFLVNSDSLSDIDLSAAAEAHAASGRTATMIMRAHAHDSVYTPVMVAPDGRVTGIAGRRWGLEAGTALTFTGIHVLEPSVLDAIPPRRASDINADIYPRLLDNDAKAVGTWLHEGWWFEAGSPARYLELNLELIKRGNRTAVVGPAFFVDEDARLDRSVLGAGARVEREARVCNSVLWRNVTVRQGASLRRCLVTDDVDLPVGGEWHDRIIMSQEDGGFLDQPLTPVD